MNIKLLNKISKASIVLISLEGYVIYKTELNDTDLITIDVSKFNSATYIVRLVNDEYYSEAVKVVVR